MSTNSHIGLLLGDGSVKYIYCHYDGYPDGVGDILKTHYRDEGKVKQLISLGAISILGEILEPSELVRRYGFDFHNNREFNALSKDEQRQLINDRYGYTAAYHRDRGEELEIQTSSSIKEYLNDGYDYKYLYIKGKWHCFEDKVELSIPSGRPVKNSDVVGSKSLSYKYTREDSVRDARKIKQVINKVVGQEFHVVVSISKSGVKMGTKFEYLSTYFDQSTDTEGEVIVHIPTYEFKNSKGKSATIKYIADLLYHIVNNRMVHVLQVSIGGI